MVELPIWAFIVLLIPDILFVLLFIYILVMSIVNTIDSNKECEKLYGRKEDECEPDKED